MNPLHVMVDIECLDTRSEAVILSIGAAKFPLLETGSILLPARERYETFYTNISIDSSMRAGCTVQGKTIKWWLQQSEFARERLFRDPEPIGLRDALSQFRGWYGEPKLTWSHGSNFDLTILDSAYALYDQLPPWRYKDVRDTRTLFWLAHTLRGTNRELMLRPGTKHDALEDALH